MGGRSCNASPTSQDGRGNRPRGVLRNSAKEFRNGGVLSFVAEARRHDIRVGRLFRYRRGGSTGDYCYNTIRNGSFFFVEESRCPELWLLPRLVGGFCGTRSRPLPRMPSVRRRGTAPVHTVRKHVWCSGVERRSGSRSDAARTATHRNAVLGAASTTGCAMRGKSDTSGGPSGRVTRRSRPSARERPGSKNQRAENIFN